MYEKILQAIRTKYANLGLSNEILEGLARQLAGFVKEETEIEAAVSGSETTLKMIQSFGDKRATSEAERLKKEYEKKTEKKDENPEDVPAWAKGIIETNKALQDKLDGFNAERTSTALSQKLTSILAEKKVPESFSKVALVGRTFKDEAEVTALADAVAAQFDVFKQDSANTGFSLLSIPGICCDSLKPRLAQLLVSCIANIKQSEWNI